MRPFSSLLIATSITGMSLAPAAADGATLYTNDLGTAAQFATFKMTATGGATLEHLSSTSSNYPDLDGDSLRGAVRYNTSGNGSVELDKTVYAPNFTTLASPRFTATGTGWLTDSGASSTIFLGVHGAFIASHQTSGNVSSSSPAPLQTQLAGPAYSNLLSVDTRARLAVASGTLPGNSGKPIMGNFKVEADVNPGQVGDRVWIYKNDFGTPGQVAEWPLEGAAITGSTVGTASDLDGDNLQHRIEGNTDAPFSSTLTVRVDAPNGVRFTDPIARAVANGDVGNWASQVTLSLSADGVDFSDIQAQTIAGTTQLLADATGILTFEGLSSLWVRIDLHAGNSGGIRPWLQDVLVSAELVPIPEPSSLLLVAAGATAMLARRRDAESR